MSAKAVTGKRIVIHLARFQLLDALVNAVPNRWIEEDLRRLEISADFRRVFVAVKIGSAVGLLVGLKAPAVGRLTARALVVYFILAVGAHARVKDGLYHYVPAAWMLGWSALASRSFRPVPESVPRRA